MAAVTEANSRIVVVVDLSETGDHALRHTVQLAKQLPNSELHIAYVIASDPGMHDARRLDSISA
jgi:nucleotide-binding universal stress UspA family protein